MDYNKKYIKYKNNYMYLKKLSGGEKSVGNLSEAEINILHKGNIQLVNGYGKLDITKWYTIPENTYIITTTKMGYLSKPNNNIFYQLINDSNNRKNFKSILENKSSIGEHFYEILEPGDIIPKIIIDQHYEFDINTTFSTNINLPKYSDDDSRYTFLDFYKKLVSNYIKKQTLFLDNTCDINFDILLELINIIYDKYKLKLKELEEIIEENNLNYEFYINILNGTNITHFKDKKNITNKDDLQFVNMLLTLLLNNNDCKINYGIKEIVDSLKESNNSGVNVIVLTSNLYIKNIYNFIYETQGKHLREYIKTDKFFFNKNQFCQYYLNKLCTNKPTKDSYYSISYKISVIGDFINSIEYLDTKTNTYFDFFPTTDLKLINDDVLKNNIEEIIEKNRDYTRSLKNKMMDKSYAFFDYLSIKNNINEDTFGIILYPDEIIKVLIKTCELYQYNTDALKLIFKNFVTYYTNFDEFEKNENFIKLSNDSKYIKEYEKLKNKLRKTYNFSNCKDRIEYFENPLIKPSTRNIYYEHKASEPVYNYQPTTTYVKVIEPIPEQKISEPIIKDDNKPLNPDNPQNKWRIFKNPIDDFPVVDTTKYIKHVYEYNTSESIQKNINNYINYIDSIYEVLHNYFLLLDLNEIDLNTFIQIFGNTVKKLETSDYALSSKIYNYLDSYSHKYDNEKDITCVYDNEKICYFKNGNTILLKNIEDIDNNYTLINNYGFINSTIGRRIENLIVTYVEILMKMTINKIISIEKLDKLKLTHIDKEKILTKYFIKYKYSRFEYYARYYMEEIIRKNPIPN